MDYAQLLGMTGGNSQSAGIMDKALGGGNVGAQLLGATPAQLPGAGFRGFAPTSTVPDLLAKYRAQAAAAPPVQAPAPTPAPAPAPAANLNYNPINPPPGGPPRLANGWLDVPPEVQMESHFQYDPTGMMWYTNDLGQIIYPYGNGLAAGAMSGG